MKSLVRLFAVLSLLASTQAQDDPRVTPAVKLIEKVRPAVVPIFSRAGDTGGSSGTGVVIHESGYILTADHVTQDHEGFVIFGLTRAPYKVVGRLPERDLALLKVDGVKSATSIPLGRSHDLRAGEPIVVGGNPGGRGLVFSQGTVNSPSIDTSWPNLLAKTFFRDEAMEDQIAAEKLHSTGGRPDYIQFDAMSNKGNSGGPLLNFHGELIGIVVQKSTSEDAVNWAIPIDRIRLWLPDFVQPEEKGGFWAGLTTDLLANGAPVTEVVPSSPAAQAGIEVGDVIQRANKIPLRSGLDWLLALDGSKAGNLIELSVRRNEASLDKTIKLADYPKVTPSKTDGKKPGLNFSVYRKFAAQGTGSRLQTGFKDLTPDDRGNVPSVSIDDLKKREKENFGVVFEGYLEVPEEGLHRLWLGADDGARLYIDGRLVIDNWLAHPYQELSRSVLVPKGLVPIRIEYFETRGDAKLTLSIRDENSGTDRSSELKLWRDEE